MCGIAGQISADPNKIAANYPAYCRMQKSLTRRGPDQRGIYLHGHAALIHARLAVVDLENGCQPMVLDQGGEKYILVKADGDINAYGIILENREEKKDEEEDD